MSKDPTMVELGTEDAALIIRADGSREVFIPKAEDESLIYGNSPTGLICKAAIALEDVECAQILQQKFEAEGIIDEDEGEAN